MEQDVPGNLQRFPENTEIQNRKHLFNKRRTVKSRLNVGVLSVKRAGWWLLIVLIASVSGWGQANLHRLNWQQAVLQALGYNPTLQLRKIDVSLQRYRAQKTLSTFLPVLQYQNINTRNIELPEFVFKVGPVEQRFRVGTPYNITHSLQLNWTLFAGGFRWWGYQAQRHLQKAMEKQLDQHAAETTIRVLETYFSALLYGDMVQLQRRMRTAAWKHLQQTRLHFRAGTTTELDTLRARARFESTLPELTAARHRRLLALENLKMLLGYAPEDSVALTDSLRILHLLPATFPLQRDSLHQLALRNRPELKASRESLSAWKSQERAAYGKFSPSIVFSASVDHQAQVETLFPDRTDFTRVKRALVTVQFPLFEGARRIIDVQEARAQFRKAQLQQELLQRQILLEVDQAYLAFREARQKLPALEETQKQAAEALRQAQLLYDQGMLTQLELLNAQVQLEQATIQWKKGIFDYNMAQFRLLKAIGTLETIVH